MTSTPPRYADGWLTIYQGDARTVLAALSTESVNCVVTSPPYWGLRNYGVSGQLGLEPTPEGERGERPFARGWRQRAIARATEQYARALSGAAARSATIRVARA
ncbi:MAG: hypothetical protein C0498_01425 [Anaerolinea sp.]|nr:hypothetical protein [Anaerolinea sp.]